MPEPVQIANAPWPSHRERLLDIRFRVFVQEQGVPPGIEEDEHDPGALHLLALNTSGEMIGCARLVVHDDCGLIGRMAVLPEHRQQGTGTRLLLALVEQARKKQLQRLQLHAQCSARGFYARQGFTAVGPVFNDAGIPHQKMVLELNGRPGA